MYQMINLISNKYKLYAAKTMILKHLHGYTIHTKCLIIVWSNNYIKKVLKK